MSNAKGPILWESVPISQREIRKWLFYRGLEELLNDEEVQL